MYLAADQAIITIANDLHLSVHEDPFHGSTAIEFRKRIRSEVYCFGFIFGKCDVTVCERRMSARWELGHGKLWFLNWVIGIGTNEPYYRELSSMPKCDLNPNILRSLVKAHFEKA